MDNPETMATLSIQDTGRRQKKNRTKHKIKKIGNTDPTEKTGSGVSLGARKG